MENIPSKIDEQFTFNLTKKYDVSRIAEIVYSYSDDEWNKDRSRQEAAPQVHNQTNTIVILEISNMWQNGESFAPELVSDNQELINLVKPILKDHEDLYDGQAGKVVFIKLPPNGRVNDHNDNGDYLSGVRRHHLPIITNDNVKFRVGNDVINMKTGECWEINNNKLHGVVNLGDSDRIHMLFDIMPKKFLV